MQIESIRIENYKGFSDSGEVAFGRGFNVLVGQNNSGKSALLEALRLVDTPSIPHSSIKYERGAPLPPHSTFSVRYSVSGQEFRRALLASKDVVLPIPDRAATNVDEYLNELFSRDRIEITFKALAGASIQATEYPSYLGFPTESGQNKNYCVRLSVSNDLQGFRDTSVQHNASDSIYGSIGAWAKTKTYVFSAQRLNIGKYRAQEEQILQPSANNLPAVLQYLQSNPTRYDRFCSHVSEIFPNIRWVSIVTVGQEFEIRIWPVDKSTERDDMALSILQGGTGVAQVLSIIYVAMTMEDSIVAIDEPNNFLHPGAVKKLIEILNSYSSNQYIIATHSTEAILSADPSTLHIVRWENGESRLSKVEMSQANELRTALAEIGTTLSDVFGPDAIVWVEGETEQFCFPEICRAKLGGVPKGLSFLALRSTSDVEQNNKSADKALALYDRLSGMGSLIPPALAFSFDRELRTDQNIEDLKRRAQKTCVLKRRTLENYLISSGAISAVIKTETGKEQDKSEIDKWITANRSSCFPATSKRWPDSIWEDYVDAPKLISLAFEHFSESTLEFRKTRHSVMLLAWRLEHECDDINDLVEYVRHLIAESDPATPSPG